MSADVLIARPQTPPMLRARYPGEMYRTIRRSRDKQLGLFRRMAALGDAAGFRIGPRRIFLLNHPDLARDLLITQNDVLVKGRALQLAKFLLGQGLLTSEGAFHRRQRKLVLPAFHHRRLEAYAAVMAQVAGRYRDAWQPGQPIRLDREMMRLTLEVVGKTLFDADVTDEADDIGRALTAGLGMFDRLQNPFAELLNRLPLPGTLRLRRARRQLDETIYGIIRRHRAAGDRGDLLSMLLEAQDEDTGRGMTDTQVRDEVMTLFLAGHETTAVALTWTFYLLADEPDAETHLHAEIDAVLGDRLPTFADLPNLPYARQVFSEALRLYPPAWAFSREAAADEVVLGDYAFRRGDTLIVSPYLLQRDERFWSEPLRFDPDRFAPGARRAQTKFAYLPFSTGVRGCIGEQFAWTEGVLVLAALARRWRLRRTNDQPVPIEPRITLRPACPVMMTPVPR